MNATEILNILNTDDDFSCGYVFYGLRADRPGIQIGERFDNSHQWYQDDPTEWGEECAYNDDLQLWDGGELNGTCTIGIRDFPTVEEIDAAMKRASIYGDQLYLVRGDSSEAGNDIGESIIHNAECAAIV